MNRAAAIAPKAAPVRANTASNSGLLQRQCACGSRTSGASGQCEGCSKKRIAGLQTKVRVGPSGDAFELEADRVADQVMAMPPRVDAPHPDSRSAAPLVQRRVSDGSGGLSDAPAIVSGVLRSPGQALDPATRDFFELRFGHDFSRVRVHSDRTAAHSADSVGALAYTVGHNVVFAENQYSPGSAAGNRLLAHELTHVVQQDASASHAQLLRRQPSSKKKGKILSLKEVAADAGREKKRANSGQSEAKVCRSISVGPSPQNCPATLAPGTVVTILEEKVGGLWLRIDPTGISGVGPKEHVHVLAAFVKDVPPDVVQAPEPSAPAAAAPTQTEPAKVEPQVEKPSDKFNARLQGIPAKMKWNGKMGRTWMAVHFCVVAMDFWFNEPKDRDTATKLINAVNKNYKDKYLTDSVFDKKFYGMSGFAITPLRMFYLAGKSSIERLRQLVIPGIGMGEATWEDQISRLKRAADEVLSVMADDVAIKDTRNIKQLDDMTSFKPAKAFTSGLLDGARGELSDEDYKKLASKLADSSLLSSVMPAIVAAGTVVGIGKEIVDALKGLYEFASSPIEMSKNMLLLIGTLMTDEEGSRALGEAIGAQEAKSLRAMTKEDVVTFTYKLGEKVGPVVVGVVLSIVTGGTVGAAASSTRLLAFLKKFPKVTKQIDRIKELLPEKKAKPDIDAPDASKPSTPPSKPDVPAESAQPSPGKPEAIPGAKKAGTKRFSDAEAKGLKHLSKNPKNLREVADKKLLDEGYELELPSGKHIYRRHRDGTWCRFSTKECGFALDPEDDAAFLKAAAEKGPPGKGVEVELTEKQTQRVRRVTEALNDDTKWGNISHKDRLRLGRVYDKVMDKLVLAIAEGSGAKTFHYVDLDANFIKKLRDAGGRVVITEGRIKSQGMRFDILEIDFSKKRGDLIDLAATTSSKHVAKTRSYKVALEKLLEVPVDATEMLYTGPKGELLETLIEVPIK